MVALFAVVVSAVLPTVLKVLYQPLVLEAHCSRATQTRG
jgi:hypothetical protein